MDKKNIEDFYPLSPMQQGMLFHSLYAPESGVYCEQVCCVLQGALDPDAFVSSWQKVIDRHTILRTAFLTENLKEPVQVVLRNARLPFDMQDWTCLQPDEVEERLSQFLVADQQRGFDLTTAPLMRLALMQTGPQTYRLVWSYHHILLDGWSTPLLLQEVLFLYEAARLGKKIELPGVKPYRDYIRWLKQQSFNAADETFWRGYLQGFREPTPLVVDHLINPELVELQGSYEIETSLSEESTAALQTLARRCQVTLSTMVQAAWGLLLSRYSGEAEVVFGVTVSGRPPMLAGAEAMIGLFINTLPVRVKVNPDVSVAAWLKALQTRVVELYQYEYSPLVQIQGWSDIPRGTPLFESLVVFENYPISVSLQQTAGSLQISNPRSIEQTNFPLNLVAGADRQLLLRILFEKSRFDHQTIERMLGHLVNLLAGFVADPNQTVGSLDLLSKCERRQLVAEWNQTRVELDPQPSLIQLFENQAAAAPNALALARGSDQLSYAQLNQRANQLAHALRRFGLAPEGLVGLCLDRSLDLAVAALATLKAGAAYVPLDPAYPPERLAFMLADCGAALLLTQRQWIEQGRFSGLAPHITVWALDDPEPPGAQESPANLNLPSQPEALAYVIYTSGSTGRPKGVMLEQRGLLNLVRWHQRAFGVRADDRATQLAGPGFDASVWELWPYLTRGASVHIPSEEIRAVPEALRDWLVAEGITLSFVPTPLAELLLGLDWPAATRLRWLLTGGDRLHLVPAAGLPFRLVNNYGPTETTVVATSGEVTEENGAGLPDIGRPIDNTRAYVLDGERHLVPVGVPGELYLAGAGVGRGYLNRPELTAAVFGADPFVAGERCYKTGDLVRYRADGKLEFIGRIDQQVKVRGFRIELGEIEAVLREHPAVSDAVAVVHEDLTGDKRIAVYLASKTGARLDSQVMTAFLAARLPAYMIPQDYVQLESLPLTPNGKVDRRALPALDPNQKSRVKEIIEPRDRLEVQVRLIWEEVLGVHPISMDDNFFDLGGHSLIAVRLTSQIKEKLSLDFPLLTLFQEPVLEKFAAALRRIQEGIEEVPLVPIQPKGDRPPMFFIHPSGGSVHWYLELSQALGKHQPFYGIQAVGLSGKAGLQTRIEEMACTYIQSLRSVQPSGPYYLGSWSMGVVIAYEMAQQLTAQGENVAFLVMLDQGPAMPYPKPADDAAYLVQIFGENLKLEIEELRKLSPPDQVAFVLRLAKKTHLVYPDVNLEQFDHFIQIMRTQADAWRNYSARPYPGDLTLILAKQQDRPANTPPDLGWSDLVRGKVKTIEVPGDHLSMMHAPHVKVLAESIAKCLAEQQVVQAESGS